MSVDDQSQQHAQTQTTLGNVTGAVLSGEFHGQVNVNAPPAPSVAAVRSIPAPPRDFTGRADDLRTLLAAFERGATITGVRGLGGIGKTALAYKLAESLASRYPDGNVFIPLYGVRPQPVAPDDAMKTVLRAVLGEEARLPEGGAALGNCYRSALHGKRLLLLFDDAKDRAHVEPLLPPASCGVLITSRQKFALPGLQPHDLDALPPEDARALLLAICPRIGALADELARVCGCLPLALRAAGSALAERIDLSPAAYRRRLEQAQARLSLIDASLSLSYELLPPEQQARWALLAVFPADFDAAAAAAVWNMDADAAQDALSDLVKWSVVDFSISPSQEGKPAPDLGESEVGGGRYRLHDLARLCAAARMETAARDAAELCHAKHYQQVLQFANDLYLQGNDAFQRGLQLFDKEWLNIQQGQRWATANVSKNTEIAELCSNFAGTGSILHLRLHPRQYVEWLQAALDAARQSKNRQAEGAHLVNFGLAYSDLGEPRRAIEYYEQGLLLLREIVDRRGEATTLMNIGNALRDLGETNKSVEHHEQALPIFREIGDRRGEGNTLGNLGLAYADLGEPRRAIEYYEQCLLLHREIGDRRGEGNALWNMSLDLNELGERAQAIQLASAALAIYAQIEDPNAEKVRRALAAWQAAQAE